MTIRTVMSLLLLLLVFQGLSEGPSVANASEKVGDRLGSDDWPWWRGPNHNGVANGPAPPVQWSDSRNIIWKAPIPGRGHASPTVVGDRVFLATAQEDEQVQLVIALDRRTGESVWTYQINQGGFPDQIHPHNTHATPTIASDGRHLFAAFNHHDEVHVTALDFDGEFLWQRTAGPYRPEKHRFGYAPSPALYGPAVIVAAEADTSAYLVALDRMTGEERWRTPRPANVTFSSPIVGHVSGRDQLLLSGSDRITAYNPNTGEQLWSSLATTRATCGTVVWDGDLVFANGGYPKGVTVGVHADSSGTVAWENATKCYEQSILAHKGYVYAVNDAGIAFCWRATTGEQMWKARLPDCGAVSASPVLAGENIYMSNERGFTYVFSTRPDAFELQATNQLGNEVFSTPAICGGRIYLRVSHVEGDDRREYLYCIGHGKR